MYHLAFRAMGCQVNIWQEPAGDLEDVPAQIETLEATLSRFRPTSELRELNRRLRQWVGVSDILYRNIESAMVAAHQTDGLVTPLVLKALRQAGYVYDFTSVHPSYSPVGFSPFVDDWHDIRLAEGRVWVPDEIDLGGTAKGWTAQMIANQLGVVLVDMGGDIVAKGKPWEVHIGDPFQPDTVFTAVSLHDCAIATSGTDYRRWGEHQHHLIDPRTAQPAQTDVLSATVIHSDAILAEAFAKAVLLQGSDVGLTWLQQQPDASGLVFCQDGSVKATESFQTFICK